MYIFIRPSIIKPKFEGGPDEYTQLKLDYAKYQIMNAEEIRYTKDPIQRWFFSPEKQSVKQKLSDLKKGVYRPIDDYTTGKRQPKSVRIERDPYFRTSAAIKKLKEQEALEKKQKRMSRVKLAKRKKRRFMLPTLRKRKRKKRSKSLKV